MKFDNNDQRRVFLQLPRLEQSSTLYDMLAYIRSELAILTAAIADLREDNKYLKRELQGVGRRSKKDETLDTTAKFNAMMERRFVWWVWARDKVIAGTLSNVLTVITLAILYMTFGGKLP